jgi:predicted acyl esterase
MRVVKDIRIPVRDGTLLAADLFLPERDLRVPALVTMSPYQKDVRWHVPNGHTARAHEFQCWETPDPTQWTQHDYAVVRIDSRGAGLSPGFYEPMSRQEARDYYDAIEWLARQDWCNGNIGATGISYYAMSQLRVAALSPPSLKAIVPWSGSNDSFREFIYRGGILWHDFAMQWYARLVADHHHARSRGLTTQLGGENFYYDCVRNELDGEFWDCRRADSAKIVVPTFGAGSWGSWRGPGHIRGNLETFKDSPAQHKYLRISHGNYFLDYYSDEVFHEQLIWFDHWLKGIGSGLQDKSPVRLGVVKCGGQDIWRSENDWPIPGTTYRKLFLGRSGEGKLVASREMLSPGAVTYEAPGELPLHAEPILGHVDETAFGVTFVSEPFTEVTDCIGEVLLHVWVSSSWDDLDLHAFLSILDSDGRDHEMSRGWLKASRRRLDLHRSTPSRPFHAHTHVDALQPNTPVCLDVEIWPISVRVNPGERVKLRLAGRGPGTLSGWHRRSRGTNTIHFGGPQFISYLQLPIAPN